jgi:hypothetical protein
MVAAVAGALVTVAVAAASRWVVVVSQARVASTAVWSEGNTMPSGPGVAGSALNSPVGWTAEQRREPPTNR